MKTTLKFLLPSIIGMKVYLIVPKLFLSKVKNLEKNNYIVNIRNGDKVFTRVFRDILKDRALKIKLIALFGTAEVTFFNEKIVVLLSDNVFNSVCVKNSYVNLKIMLTVV